MEATPREVPLNEEQRQRFEEELRHQLEEEHRERVAKTGARSKRAPERSEEYQRAVVAKELRERFYEEKGYVQYKNSRGEVEWLLPDEAARRKEARKRRKRRKRGATRGSPREALTPLAWALLIVGFLMLGLFLGYYVLRG